MRLRAIFVGVGLLVSIPAICECRDYAVALASRAGIMLPSGWMLRPPAGAMTLTDTMPQGAAASPDGSRLAVVESGFNPATLRIYRTSDLEQIASIPLSGAMGRPLWIDDSSVLVAGDNADVLFRVDVTTQKVVTVPLPAKSHPVAVARFGDTFAVATDGDGSLRVGALDALAKSPPLHIGSHPAAIAFAPDGRTVFCSDRASSSIAAIDVPTLHMTRIHTGLHPSDLLVRGSELYVAESDNDSVAIFHSASHELLARIYVGENQTGDRLPGASPNALAAEGNRVFVSLGAANAIAVLRGSRIVDRIPAGRYPTDIVPVGSRLFIINGKGEGTQPNPHLDAISKSFYDYVGEIEYGSIRVFDLNRSVEHVPTELGSAGWSTPPAKSVIRKNGPIKHVFFILKENRSYDQVLGDIAGANGEKKLVLFGEHITPNQHALARRFGVFDNTYSNGEVSDAGHNWADAAFANDYVERMWPPTYGNRRDNDEVLAGEGAAVPHNGYIWDEARRSHVSFRDYGELADVVRLAHTPASTAPGLRGPIDQKYVGWNLEYSDLDRVKEWRREFREFLRSSTVPQLEYIWLPNDHTYGARIGKRTPQAYVAINDYAVGQIVDEISHSAIWGSSAVFVIEDDAQDGADHVSDQRTTLYVASPYAKGGVQHRHYSTVSVLRTIELILGMKPLSAYDGMAVPLNAAFTNVADQAPYIAIPPLIDVRARNGKRAYGAKVSALLDFTRPDAAPPSVLRTIIECNVAPSACSSRH